ncbi:hypothetical protein WR25_27170 [Diploscapter pachys]|uniref:FYVE-type domain-containing protein n=1 Tax=Diploscapter pachys TaxID=2018661 RepID=A0A2A2LWF0_9BILA|nr:hypothetical protein WR25_27170 [Diploscapter pachys]
MDNDAIDIDALLDEVEVAVSSHNHKGQERQNANHSTPAAATPATPAQTAQTDPPAIAKVPPLREPVQFNDAKEEQAPLKLKRPEPPFRPKAIINSLQFDQPAPYTLEPTEKIVQEPEEKGSDNSEQLINFSEPEPESAAEQVEQIREVPKILGTKEEKEAIKQEQDAEQMPKNEVDEMKDVMDYLDGFSDEEEEQEVARDEPSPVSMENQDQSIFDEQILQAVELAASEMANLAVEQGIKDAGEWAKVQQFYGDKSEGKEDEEVEKIMEKAPEAAPEISEEIQRPATPISKIDRPISDVDEEIEEIFEIAPAEQIQEEPIERPLTPVAKELEELEAEPENDEPSTSNEQHPDQMDAESEQIDAEGLTTAIEVANSPTMEPRRGSADTGEGSEDSGSMRRFDAIAIVHDLSDLSSIPHRLTESELQLGKQQPYWIPDADSPVCMICSTKFTLLNRRHHCRACGRVLCAACCKQKAALEYMKEDPKNDKARVCTPCFTMLARIEEYEREQNERAANSGEGVGSTPANSGNTPRVNKGVLKSRALSTETEAENGNGNEAGPSQSNSTPENGERERKRTVVFRDGVKPGTSREGADETEGRSTTLKPKKKQRKRQSVARRIAELKIEEELANVLPESDQRPYFVLKPDGNIKSELGSQLVESLSEGNEVVVAIKRNLHAAVKLCTVETGKVLAVCSRGFIFVGLDEVLFCWRLEDEAQIEMPLPVLHRISSLFGSCTDSDSTGVRRACGRLPSIHSVPEAFPPLPRHILFFRSSAPSESLQPLPVPPESVPLKVACFLHDDELPWAMANPNRILSRLALQYNNYSTPVVNHPNRPALSSADTSASILKVFTDFRSWTYRLKYVPGSSIVLQQSQTTIKIPRSTANEIKEIISWNKTLLAWWTDLDAEADSRLVCSESDGIYSTKLLKKNEGSSLPTSTSSSFVIFDGSLKGAKLRINIVEDGIAVRLSSESLLLVVEAFESQNDLLLEDDLATLKICWVDDEHSNKLPHSQLSAIDGKFLGLNWQYGLSLERAINSGICVPSSPSTAIRLSHVYNLREGRFSLDDEAKIFALIEILANESTGLLDAFVPSLLSMDIRCVSLRLCVSPDQVGYEVAEWNGLEDDWLQYKVSLDQLLPTLYNMLDFVPSGFDVELVLSLVTIKSPSPTEE